jgi:glycosyltransferase involved in cell wall biosynthesis
MPDYRLGLDIRMLENSGIGTYLRGLLWGFEALGIHKNLAVFGPKPDATHPERIFSAPIYSIREQLQYPARLKQCRLWHAPHYNVPLRKGRTKLVVTIHDIIHWIFRKQFLSPIQAAYAGFMLKKAVSSADQIIAVSHHTQKDLIDHFHAPEQKITVIHQGVDETCRELAPAELAPAFEKIREKYKVPQDFFLYVGLIKPHKNILRLTRLFRRLKQVGKVRASLVLIGRKDKAYPPGYEALASLSSTQDIFYLPSIEPQELKVFYNQALALVHPSLYEGFGLTLLEAMGSGTPVLTTNSSSIPEVVDDAALRVDATDESEMGNALIRLDQDARLRESLRVKGLERVKYFSWKETARKTAAVYEKALAEK